jgi:hypothetical protein
MLSLSLPVLDVLTFPCPLPDVVPFQTNMVAAIWSGQGPWASMLKSIVGGAPQGYTLGGLSGPSALTCWINVCCTSRAHPCVRLPISGKRVGYIYIYIYIYISEPHTPFRWILIVMGTSPIYTGYTGYTRYSRYLVLQCLDILAQQRSGLFCDHLDVWPK